MELTRARLADLLHYDPETGIFTWTKPRRGVRVGHEAGRLSALGYREIGVDYVLRRANRLAFLYMTGAMPPDGVVIDHINGVADDNRWANLRQATLSQNAINGRLRTNNTSGTHGVTFDAARDKWRAQIRIAGRKVNLGRFSRKEDAIAAYVMAAKEHHGEFAPGHALNDGSAGNSAGISSAP